MVSHRIVLHLIITQSVRRSNAIYSANGRDERRKPQNKKTRCIKCIKSFVKLCHALFQKDHIIISEQDGEWHTACICCCVACVMAAKKRWDGNNAAGQKLCEKIIPTHHTTTCGNKKIALQRCAMTGTIYLAGIQFAISSVERRIQPSHTSIHTNAHSHVLLLSSIIHMYANTSYTSRTYISVYWKY